MKTIAIGPETTYPSWQWVGKDTAQELKKYFNVVVFSKYKNIPDCDVIVSIKQPGICNKKTKLIYCPIDYFHSESQIKQNTMFQNKIDLILSHSKRLISLFGSYCKSEYIDHHGKYFLPNLANYKESGYVLWIGGFQYVPYLLEFIQKNSLRLDLRILSDFKNASAIRGATFLAQKLNIDFKIINNCVNGIQLFEWSEELQAKMMMEAKAAIDIKGNDFNQLNKPPTKSQQFIFSGLPLAMNSESESVEHFEDKGFKICSPCDANWLSKEYYDKTFEFAKKFRNELSLESIGLKYKYYIDTLL